MRKDPFQGHGGCGIMRPLDLIGLSFEKKNPSTRLE
jgi:hypothetical protein